MVHPIFTLSPEKCNEKGKLLVSITSIDFHFIQYNLRSNTILKMSTQHSTYFITKTYLHI